MIRVTIDKERCVSAGRCIADEPDAFEFDSDELAQTRSTAQQLPVERLVILARRCPGMAIEVFSDDGTKSAP